ncbi:unnamed protein product [Gordionus sp. m RMFG-2023]|uniref:androgen-induced gene 1 protein-like isoform X2 n=1 Tax=Gordionus sp. m RMFG-2023 TaxID=3053472 RepID=UPI0030E4EF9E
MNEQHSKKTYISLIFHNLIFWIYLLDLYYHFFSLKLLSIRTYAGECKYLTIWCLCVQTLYFGIATLYDLIFKINEEKSKNLKKIRDYICTTYAFPMGTAVSILFWALYAVDRELVYPKFLDEYIPSWHNNILHTGPIVFLLMDSFICHYDFKPFKSRVKHLIGFICIYYTWLMWVRFFGNVWIYPIFHVLSTYEIFLFLSVIVLLFITFSFLGQKVNQIIWRPSKIPKNML